MGKNRFDEIDILRGIAVIMMILFHIVFDLSFFRLQAIEISTGFWRLFAIATASLFLLLVGISLTISDAQAMISLDRTNRFRKVLLRGAEIFGLGLLVTFVTWLYLGNGYVIFGILHLIGISVILGWFFLRLRKWNLPLGITWILTGVLAVSSIRGPISLAWLGFYPAGFTSIDFTPLFPWFGLVLAGVGLGSIFYPEGTRTWTPPSFPAWFDSPVTFLGRHSLVIYLVHQPVILFLLQILSGKSLIF